MVTAYSPILKLALPVQGELSGTWGDVVNDNITSMVEQAIAGRAVIDTWTTNSHTLTTANGTTSESRCAMLELTDTGTALTGAGTVICPTASKIYIVKNASGQNITVKTSGGTGILVPNGRTTFLFCDGTNVVEAMTHTTSLQLGTSTTVTAVLDEDNMASDSATALATQQSIKAYVDAQVGAFDSLAEVLAVGNTTGANDIIVDNGQKITVNTIDETTAGSGVTIDSVLLKDDVVNATDIETGSISANDGTTAATIANSTGVVTVPSAVLTTADINGGTADGVVIGGSTPAAATVTTAIANTSLNIAGTVTVTSILDEDNLSSDDPAGLATQQSIKAYVDAQVGSFDTLAEVLAQGNTTGGNDIVFSAGDNISNASGDFTLDVAGDIILDADGGEIFFKDGGASTGKIRMDDGDLQIRSLISDKNVTLEGNDGGSIIAALTLDMSEAGKAIFSAGAELSNNVTITTADNTTQLTLTSTDADAGVGPRLDFFRNSANPADFDMIGVTRFLGENDAGETIAYAAINARIEDMTDGQEDGRLDLRAMIAGTEGTFMKYHAPDVSGTLEPEVVFNDGSLDMNFRVESNASAAAFFVDGGANRVSIGTSSADAPFHVVTDDINTALFQSDSSTGAQVFIRNSTVAAGTYAQLGLAPANNILGGSIIVTADEDFSSAANRTAHMELQTRHDGTNRTRLYLDESNTTFNPNSRNTDFTIKSSGNANMLFVDAGANYVGIGSATNYSAKLAVEGSKTLSAGIPNYQLTVVDDTAMAAGTGGAINFWGNYTTAGSKAEGASIEARKANATTGNYQYGILLKSRTHGGSMDDRLYMDQTQTVFNELGGDTDFRVESNDKEKMLFVDGGENVFAVGMLDDYTTPSWIGNGSFVMADNFYQFQGANTGAGVWNQSVDTNQSYHMHNAYYSGGWKQHVASVSATMYQSGSGLHRFQVANASGSADAAISWRPLLNMNEAAGFDWNPSDYATADFKVRSDGNANMLFVDAGADTVSIGTSSSLGVAPLNIQCDDSARSIRIVGRSDDYAEIDFFENNNTTQLVRHQAHNTYYQIRTYAIPLKLATNSIDRLVIDINGNKIMRGSNVTAAGIGAGSSSGSYFGNAGDFYSSRATGTNSIHVRWYNTNGLVGNIATNGSATNYNTSSDYRLKENVDYTWDATTRLKQLKPARFNFIADANTTVDGFLAHEVQSVVPEAISGTKDEVDADGNAVMQSIDQAKLVPLLVKTIQELEARITALENA